MSRSKNLEESRSNRSAESKWRLCLVVRFQPLFVAACSWGFVDTVNLSDFGVDLIFIFGGRG